MASERSSNCMEAHTKWRLKLVNTEASVRELGQQTKDGDTPTLEFWLIPPPFRRTTFTEIFSV